MKIYSPHRKDNINIKNTLKYDVYMTWNGRSKSVNTAVKEKYKVFNQKSGEEHWLRMFQERINILKDKAMEYIFPESVA